MNYYEELFEKIESLIDSKQYTKACYLLEEELEIVYIPKEYEDKMHFYLDSLKPLCETKKELTNEEIETLLQKKDESQLIAVSALSKKNLREHLDTVNRFLVSDSNPYAKALLIDALINQEISDEIKCTKEGLEYNFIPRFILPVEESEGYIKASEILNEYYMKEPSKAKMAMDLLFKEGMMLLPLSLEEEEGQGVAEKIIQCIESAFNGELL